MVSVHRLEEKMGWASQVIRTRQANILERWTREAQRAASVRGLDVPELTNVMPSFLLALADASEHHCQFRGKWREHVESHLSARLRQTFPLVEIIEEFVLLGRCVTAAWKSDTDLQPPDDTEVETLFEELHFACIAVAETFTRHILNDEEAERRYLSCIRTVARETMQPNGPTLRARLNDMLSLLLEATAAQSAALLLCNSTHLELAAAAGLGDKELLQHVISLSSSSVLAEVCAQDDAISMLDARTTELEVSDALRRVGIRSLLGIRLCARHRLIGIMLVGLAEERRFEAREIGRLESFGQQLTLHMDHAKLYAELREHIDQLTSERDMREQFVSTLAHDLRGPLSVAKMSSQILMNYPEGLDERRNLAQRIDRNIDRTDRMIRDLLDANRIRAGESLPLRISECVLGDIARDVCEELTAAFGNRFVLHAEDGVQGFWSADELRRAIWNLATNAVKYGAANRPITLSVRKTHDGAAVCVHNWGAAIPAEDQQRLFRPFSRIKAAEISSQKGWGLGLTLVQGCAEAHRGRVTVESTDQSGTTFTITIPLDARGA